MNVIHGRGKQLQDELNDEHKAAADAIVNRADALLTTSEKSRAITDSLSNPGETGPTDIAQLVRRLTEEITADWPDMTVMFQA